jgi:rod shape-determining protein MreD
VTPPRVAAAAAGLVTALLLQAAVVAPVAATAPVSLPAVFVAAVALTEGPGTGMAVGFATGLLADLGSEHAAGVLALAWLALGTCCGLLRDQRARGRRDVAVAALLATAAGVAVAALLALLPLGDAQSGAPPRLLHVGIVALLVHLALAALVVPLVRLLARNARLRRPAPVLVLGGER